MGRGRAKAKQTKVARALKYQTLDTNFDALQRELGHDDPQPVNGAESDELDDDPYADYLGDDEDADDEDADSALRRG